MPFREPAWWYADEAAPAARLLAPVGWIYGRVAAHRLAGPPLYASEKPVVCIGNFTAGGTGKTPLALLIARRLQGSGIRPAFLTRGYGSAVREPTLVDVSKHTAGEVGDEALLLARIAPVMVSPDRVAGARALGDEGLRVDVLLMDDGLQNPDLAKDATIALVDGARRFGNERVIPAGPLRAPLDLQLAKTDLIVVNGRREDRDQIASRIAGRFSGPVLSAHAEAADDSGWLKGARVLAFAGIGNPLRFFSMLESHGATLAAARIFPDHHPFSDADASSLLDEAKRLGAQLVTTEKDFVRLRDTGAQALLRRSSREFKITLAFNGDGEAALLALVTSAIEGRERGSRP